MNNKLFSYRPDIDGLRAMAVSAVVMYHIFPNIVTGGFVGVDIFFVISGYLISSIIFSDLRNGKFKFHEFYIRRIKRIFPALLLMLLVVSVWGAIVLLPAEQLVLWLIIRKTASFVTNIHLYNSAFDYFSTINDNQKPLLHMWSLSLEEQFYIIYPVLIWIIYKIKKDLVFPILLICLLASFYLNIIYLSSRKEAVFYLLHFRAWELLIGASIAYIAIFKREVWLESSRIGLYFRSSYVTKNLASLVATFFIIYPCIILNSKDIYPGILALYPTVGAALLIVTKDSWVNRYIFSNKVLVYIGLISYPLYLWHWPIISFANLADINITVIVGTGILLVSVVAAIATTFLFENKIRKSRSHKLVPFLLMIGMALVFILSAACYRGYIRPANFFHDPEVMKVATAVNDWGYPSNNLIRDRTNSQFYSFGSGQKKIVFFGDSNLEQYWPRVENLISQSKVAVDKYTILFATYGGVIPILQSNEDIAKQNFVSDTWEYINAQNFDTVVLGANWAGYFYYATADNREKMYHNFEDMLKILKKQSKNIYVILNIPTMKEQDPKKILNCNRHFASTPNCEINLQKTVVLEEWLSRYGPFIEILKNIALKVGAKVIDPIEALCPNGNCLVLDNDNRPVYKDASHLTASYVRKYGTFIDEVFKN